MMKAVTQSHVALQSVRGGLLISGESTQWIRAIEDKHSAAKHQAEDKLEEMGALVLVESPPSKAMAKTQLKRSERTLQDNTSKEVTNMNRLVIQQMLFRTRSKFMIYSCEFEWVYRAELHRGSARLNSSRGRCQRPRSSLSPSSCGLVVLHCLDDDPLAL